MAILVLLFRFHARHACFERTELQFDGTEHATQSIVQVLRDPFPLLLLALHHCIQCTDLLLLQQIRDPSLVQHLFLRAQLPQMLRVPEHKAQQQEQNDRSAQQPIALDLLAALRSVRLSELEVLHLQRLFLLLGLVLDLQAIDRFTFLDLVEAVAQGAVGRHVFDGFSQPSLVPQVTRHVIFRLHKILQCPQRAR